MASDERNFRLGDLQLRIMKVLWASGPASVAQVHRQLDGPRLAYTTVATMLRKMEDRQLVRHQTNGRKFIYQAAVTAEQVSRSAADDLVERLFEGSLADTLTHLLRTREVSPAELDQLQRLIEQRKKSTR